MEIIGAGDRLAARWEKFKKLVTGQSRTRMPDRVRVTRMGTETVRMTPVMRKALPANQTQQKRGQTTAKRPVRCQAWRLVRRAQKRAPAGAPRPGPRQRALPGRRGAEECTEEEVKFFKSRGAPRPAPGAARGTHSDESRRTRDVRPARPLERKKNNRQPLGSFSDPDYEGSREDFDARQRDHPQVDRCWPSWHGQWGQGRKGPV